MLVGPQSPGAEEIVFRARAPDRGLALAVDVDLLVAFAEPGRAAGAHGQHRAHVVPLALGFQQDVILALLDGVFLPVLGVEVGRVVGQLVLLDPVDVVVQQADGLFAFIDDLDAGRLAKRHPPEAVVGVAVGHGHRDADDLAALAEAVGEEVAQRGLDRRPLAAVPVHAEQHFLVIGRALGRPGCGSGPRKVIQICVITPGPCSSRSTWVSPGSMVKLSQLLASSRSPLGSALGFSFFCLPPRRTSPTRMVDVARIERPSCGLARSSSPPSARADEAATITISSANGTIRPISFFGPLLFYPRFVLWGG